MVPRLKNSRVLRLFFNASEFLSNPLHLHPSDRGNRGPTHSGLQTLNGLFQVLDRCITVILSQTDVGQGLQRL